MPNVHFRVETDSLDQSGYSSSDATVSTSRLAGECQADVAAWMSSVSLAA